MTAVPTGRYRHYRGKEYTVLGVARHSETEEELAVYRQEYGDHSLWVRPVTMFREAVESGGEVVPRLQVVGELGGFPGRKPRQRRSDQVSKISGACIHLQA
jgi:hypothetical protein